MKVGLTLPNRGVLLGIVTPDQLLGMAETADASGLFDSVWVGDSLFGKPRMESITLLAALAARTRKVRLGVACMASFPLRDPVLLAYQWASLDLLSHGRTVMVACTGIVGHEGGKLEADLYKVTSKDRVGRLIEGVQVLKALWTQDNVSFNGDYYQFEGISVDPKPMAKPRPPIWIASNASGSHDVIERTHMRVALHADGWETSLSDLADLTWRLEDIRTKTRTVGRDPADLSFHLYHNINVNNDRKAALEETGKFLRAYYSEEFSPGRIESWTAAGNPEQCLAHLNEFAKIGFGEIALRITSFDQEGQLMRILADILPRLNPSA